MVLAIATHGRAEHEKNPPRGCELGEFKPECVCVCLRAHISNKENRKDVREAARREREREREKL